MPGRRSRALGLAVALAFAPAAALACPPPPPPPAPWPDESPGHFGERLRAIEAEELARTVEAQQRRWAEAASVVLARVERVEPIRSGLYDGMNRATLLPMRALKGSAPRRAFVLADSGMTDCGAYGAGDATAARSGEVVLLYLRRGRPSARTLLDAIAETRVRDPRARLLIDQPY